MIRESKELQIGKAGEYLVCADLILKGFVAFPSEQGLPYDVVLDTGYRIIKVQVKTTSKPRKVLQRANETSSYVFNVKRAGKNGKTRYNIDEIDMFALVALDTMQIGYVLNKEMPTTLLIRVDALKGRYYDEKGINDYKIVNELHKNIKSKTEISKITGLNNSTVGKYLKDDYTPHVTKSPYFSDYIRGRDFFLNI